MEFIVVIHADTPLGAHLASLLGQVGGASATLDVQGKKHPAIVATDLEWGSLGWVQMTHLQDPGAGAQSPRRLVVPTLSVVMALEKQTANQPSDAQQRPVSLH